MRQYTSVKHCQMILTIGRRQLGSKHHINSTLMKFTNSLDKARSKMIVLTIYFE